jgi:hypothetical protein
LSEDLADDAIGWLQNHKSFAPDKPFFMYWASGASHGPHQITKEWAEKYKGKFDDGWDKYRERVFARQKAAGYLPQNALLTPRPDTLASWDSIPESELPFQRRLMELFAGFTEHVDAQVGRIVDEVDRLGYGDNTIIFYVWGDNGSSAEGQGGTISELLAQNGIPTTIDQHIKALNELGGLDVLGSPKIDNMYHAGWAWAGSTPYKSTKLIAAPRLRKILGGRPLIQASPPLKIEVHRIGTQRLFCAPRLRLHQLGSQPIRQPSDDLVLHVEEVGHGLVEALGPEVIAGFGVDELDVDAHAATAALH